MNTELRAFPKHHLAGASEAANQTYAGIDTPEALSRPLWLSQAVWPFITSGMDVDGHRVAYTDTGQGPVLLFVHTGFWSLIWRDVILRLAPEFRCICFDAQGTGRSERLPPDAIRLEGAARAQAALVRRLDLQDITLVFHDLGGPSGLAGAARLPDRFRGLCAVNTFGWKPAGAALRFMLGLMGSKAMREFDAWTGILPRITATAFGIGRHMDGRSREAFLAGIGREGVRAFHSYLRDAAKSKSVYRQVDEALSGPLRHLPLLTIFGERNDPFGFQPRWKQLFREARQVVVRRGNHFPMCDDPELVASSIRAWHRDHVRPNLPAVRPDRAGSGVRMGS